MEQLLVSGARWLVMPGDESREPLGRSAAAGLVGPATRMVEIPGECPVPASQTIAQPRSDTAEHDARDAVPQASLGWLRDVVQQASLH